MALTERLALLVSLDANGAVKGLNDIGKAADKNLSKAEQKMDRLGAGFKKAGAGMAAAGGLLAVGLFHAAKASEEANLAVVKLDNSLKNNPRLAGESSKAFIDLADSIQDKTAADGDAIVAGQAMLATFRVTGDQIRELTPLVVDYARKFGTDLVTANAAVGKALDGSIGALKRNGVSIDETLYKTDRYAAVQKALAEQVGGFAEAEGKTFAGSLERLKNQLGDLEESVGKGAVDAFTSMLEAMNPVINKLTEMDPAISGTVGKFATFGSVGLIAAGGLSYVVGKAIELRTAIKDLPSRINQLTGGLKGLRTAGIVAGGALGTALLIQYGRSLKALKVDVDELAYSLNNIDDADPEDLKFFNAVVKDGGTVAKIIDQMAESNVAGAQRLLDYAEANGLAADKVTELQGVIDGAAAANAQAASDQNANAEAIDGAIGPTDELADATGGLTEEIESAADAYDRLLNATLSQFDADISYRQSLDSTEDALAAVNEALQAHGANSEEYRRASLDAEAALLDQADAAAELYIKTAEAGGAQLDAADKTNIQKSALEGVRDTLAPGNPLRQALDQYIFQMGAIPSKVETSVRANVDSSELDRFIQKLGLIRGTIAANVQGGNILYGGERAAGGPVSAGKTYLVGERGPELLTMGGSGNITPNGAMGGGSQTIVVKIGDRVLEEIVIDAQRRYESRNGKGWRG